MANPFEEIEKAQRPSEPGNVPALGGNPFGDIEAPRPSAPAPGDKKSGMSGPLLFADNIMRRIASAATLGLIDYADDRPEQDAQFRKEHPYVALGAEVAGGILPGAGAGLALGKAVPALGKATIPSIMGNAAVTGGGLSAVEDIIKGNTDPRAMAARAGTSAAVGGLGAGLISGGLRMLPEFKFRASGSELTDADRAGMKAFADKSGKAGIPLRVPEVAAEVAPGRAARLESIDNFASGMKEGGISRSNFDQGRIPDIRRAVESVRGVVKPAPGTGAASQEAAENAIKQAESLVRGSAKPYYEAAEGVLVPGKQTHPNIIATQKKVARNKTLAPEIKGMPKNSIKSIQFTADELENQIARTANPTERGLLIGQKKGLLDSARSASDDFGIAQDMTHAGKSMVEGVRAGPLGKIAGSGDLNTQSKALFGVDSPAEVNEARKAIERLRVSSPDVPRGLLASRVDEAARDPLNFGKKLAPTSEVESVVKEALGPDFDKIKDIVAASRARKAAPSPRSENADGPVAAVWDALQNSMNKGVVDRMNDVKNIDKLGKQGVTQRLLNAFGLSLEDEAIDNLIREPLVVDVKPKRKTNTRTASAR
jgi:hypothetical protein